MPHCTVPLCTNHSRKTVGTGISYHKLPTGPLKNIWLRNIRRENIRANVHTRVCSEHFTEDSFEPAIEIIPGFKKSEKLKSTAVPTVFAFHTRANEDKARPSSLKQIQSRARKVVSTEKKEFALGDSPGCWHDEDSMDISISIAEVDQGGPSMELKANKEVQTSPDQVKMFRTIGTQTVDFSAHQKPDTKHPNDINKLSHLEDHSYSLGPKAESSVDDHLEIVKPCTEFQEQSLFPDCCDSQNETIIVESGDEVDNDQSDNCSVYCPSASEDNSETDDECSTITPTAEKKIIVFESHLFQLFKFCQNCGSPIDATTQNNQGSMVTITATCIILMDMLYPGSLNHLSVELLQETSLFQQPSYSVVIHTDTLQTLLITSTCSLSSLPNTTQPRVQSCSQ